VHCHDHPLRPPTERSIASQKLAVVSPGLTRSSLTNDDRIALQIFTKPWRGIARERGQTTEPMRRMVAVDWNTVLPANFAL
jgi:hypothetical protein